MRLRNKTGLGSDMQKIHYVYRRIMRFRIVAILMLLIFGVLIGTQYVYRSNNFIPVLMYHHFQENIPKELQNMSVTPAEFEEQIRYFQENGYTAIGFDELLQYRQGKISLPKKPILLTMDDGYSSNYEVAYAILKKYNMKATIFINTAYVGQQIWELPHFSWEEAAEMSASGIIDIRSHGHYHIYHNKITEEEVIENVQTAQTLLDTYIGEKEAKVFAYPHFGHTKRTQMILKELGYDMQITKLGKVISPISSLEDIRRINVPHGSTPADIELAIIAAKSTTILVYVSYILLPICFGLGVWFLWIGKNARARRNFMLKKLGKYAPLLVIGLSILLSGFRGWQRYGIEKDYNEVQILINYDELKDVSMIMNRPIEEIAEMYKQAGATGILVKERSVRPAAVGAKTSLEETREVVVYEGNQLLLLNALLGFTDNMEILPANRYLWISDELLRKSVAENLNAKLGEGDIVTIGTEVFVDAGPSNEAVYTLGVGYPIYDLEKLAALGFTISPQIRDFPKAGEESLNVIFEQAESLPNLGVVYFNDINIPGAGTTTVRKLAERNQIGLIELFSEKQKGIDGTIRQASKGGRDFNTIRMHTMSVREAGTLPPQQILSRFLLGVKERNMRAVMVRIPSSGDIKADITESLDIVIRLHDSLTKSGFQVQATTKNLNLPQGRGALIWLIGLGPLAGIILLGKLIKQEKWAYVVAIIGLVGWTGLLKLQPILAKQAMALAGTIVYPTLAVAYVYREKPRSIFSTLKAFFLICLISAGGIFTIVGLLSQTSFAFALDLFKGVKIAHAVPLVLILILLQVKFKKIEVEKYKKLLLHPVNVLLLIGVGIFAGILLIYMQRTGNLGSISPYELMFRQTLDRVLGVRPRTKEFLIGHPLMILSLYLGYKDRYIPIVLGAIIGQISLVNTFAHIHTPLMISITRLFHGLWIGIILGIAAIYAVRLICYIGRRFQLWPR